MKNKILTISIAGYNVEKYIYKTLESLCDIEVLDKLEVIVTDDGGTDSTESIVKDFVNKHPRTFRFIHKENGGWGSTVNIGLMNAHGRYFKVLDGDDQFETINLKKYIEHLERSNADISYTSYYQFNSISNTIEKRFTIDSRLSDERDYKISECKYDKLDFHMHNLAFKTTFLKQQNMLITEHCFYTDVEYVLKGIKNAKTISFFKGDIYRYRVGYNEQSCSKMGLKKHWRDHLKMVMTVLNEFDTVNDKYSREIYIKILQEVIKTQYNIFFMLSEKENFRNNILDFDKIICSKYSNLNIKLTKRVRLAKLLRFYFMKYISYGM